MTRLFRKRTGASELGKLFVLLAYFVISATGVCHADGYSDAYQKGFVLGQKQVKDSYAKRPMVRKTPDPLPGGDDLEAGYCRGFSDGYRGALDRYNRRGQWERGY